MKPDDMEKVIQDLLGGLKSEEEEKSATLHPSYVTSILDNDVEMVVKQHIYGLLSQDTLTETQIKFLEALSNVATAYRWNNYDAV